MNSALDPADRGQDLLGEYSQRFIQAVLLISVFERRLSFRMLYFVKKDHKIILQKGWVLEALSAVQRVHGRSIVEYKGVNPDLFMSGG